MRLTRRGLLGYFATIGASPALATEALTDWWRPQPARIRGRVASGGRGIPNAVVSDGLSCQRTGSDGEFEIISDRRQRFAFVSTPRGFALPVSDEGTAQLFAPLDFNPSGEAEAAFELGLNERESDHHRFLAFGDTQLDEMSDAEAFRTSTIPEVADLLRANPASFGVTCGDIVDDSYDLFVEYSAAVGSLGLPFFQVIGNHDLDAAQGATRGTRLFESHFGPTYYSFNRGEVHYVVLNDVLWLGNGYVGFVSEEQIAWLACDLQHVEPGATLVVFAHVPFASTISERIGGKIAANEAQVTNRERVFELLEPFEAHLVTSHTHDNEHVDHGSCEEHILGPVCGAWWNGPIAWDGTPNGYHLFDANGSELSWRFRGTGLPEEQQFRLYEPGADPRHPGEYIANVWNWDPTWKVYWVEDGARRGEMTRARGFDPLAVSLYAGDNRPATNGAWVEPVLTDHLFFSTPSKTAKTVGVEVVDRWGRRYSETRNAG